MDKTERILSYVFLVMLLIVLFSTTILSFNLSIWLFQPTNYSEGVLWFIFTALLSNLGVIFLLNVLIFLINKVVVRYRIKE